MAPRSSFKSFGAGGRQSKGVLKNYFAPGSEPKESGSLEPPLNRHERRAKPKKLKKFLGKQS